MPAKRPALTAALLLLLTGCSGEPPTAPGLPVPASQSLIITADCDTIGCRVPVGSEWTFSAVVLQANGSRETREAEWTTDDATLATVDTGGRVRAIRSGATMIRAKVGSLTSGRAVQVRPRQLGSWKGRWVPRACSATGDFDPTSWCAEYYLRNGAVPFDLTLWEENGRLTGGIGIGFDGGLEVDEGASLDPEGNLRLSAQGDGGLGWLGPFVAVIDPLEAQIRGTVLEGRFTMRVLGAPGSGLDGAILLEADLEGVTQR